MCGAGHRSERSVLFADTGITSGSNVEALTTGQPQRGPDVEATELRRSTLERKDRDELVTIATALGAKPPSRARKAEIVDLIITSATTAGADAPEEPDVKEEAVGDDAAGSEDDGSTYHAGDDEFDFGEVTTKKKSGKGDGNGSGKGKGAKSKKGDASADNNDEAPTERGNRRRRRRGRGGDNDSDSGPVNVDGHLDLREDGYGFLRVGTASSSMDDAYVSVKQVRQFGLRKGDHLVGTSRPANRNEKNPAMLTIDSINGSEPSAALDRRVFDALTALHPSELLSLEGDSNSAAMRMMDLLTPIGKGQRGVIVAPPRTGKTTLIAEIAASIEANYPELNLFVLLIDERPEDITVIKRAVKEAEVITSPFDRPADEHAALADMTVERAKRLVELGRDVVLLFDGVSRLVRTHNQTGSSSGRTMPGGIDANSIYPAKRLLGAARAMEEGGSLTVVATASADEADGDDSILQALTGLANMELRLHRGAALLGTHPAIDVMASQTRNDSHLVDDKVQSQLVQLRSALEAIDDPVGDGLPQLEKLLDLINGSKNNAALLKDVAKGV